MKIIKTSTFEKLAIPESGELADNLDTPIIPEQEEIGTPVPNKINIKSQEEQKLRIQLNRIMQLVRNAGPIIYHGKYSNQMEEMECRICGSRISGEGIAGISEGPQSFKPRRSQGIQHNSGCPFEGQPDQISR